MTHDYKAALDEMPKEYVPFVSANYLYSHRATILHALRLADKVTGEPSEGMWEGLPRALVMGRDLNCHKADKMREHLQMAGYDIPGWLDEELRDNKHLAKGDMCVMIFKAMIEAARKGIE